ncbi:MAG: hypothetical protein ACLFMT_07740 [Halobacteriales archaeon]
MNRSHRQTATTALTFALVATLALSVAFAGAAVAQEEVDDDNETVDDVEEDNETVDDNTSNDTEEESLTPEEAEADVRLSFGEQISILVANHDAEVEHEIENQAFQVAFDRDGEEAVEERAHSLNERLERLEQRRQEIDEREENGEVSERRATAQRAKLSAQAEASNRSADVALERAEAEGVNVTAIETLKQRASEMSGEEVSEIARNIAGPRVAEERRPGAGGPPGREDSNDTTNDTDVEREADRPQSDDNDTRPGPGGSPQDARPGDR